MISSCCDNTNVSPVNPRKRPAIGVGKTIPAVYYRNAVSFPREDKILNQNIQRMIEIFIPEIKVCYTFNPDHNALFTDKPRNIYAIDLNPRESTLTTRPLNDSIFAESALENIQISEDLCRLILALAKVAKARLADRRKFDSSLYDNMKADIAKQANRELSGKIPEKKPEEYEHVLPIQKRVISSCASLDQEIMDTQCIWYARFRSPNGIRLYLGFIPEAQQLFDSLRAEIRLTPEDDELLQEAFMNLYESSTTAAKERYKSADAALKAKPSREAEKEKKEAYIGLYENAPREAQDQMDIAYYNCFSFIDYPLRVKLAKAMLKLYTDAPKACRDAFDAAWL